MTQISVNGNFSGRPLAELSRLIDLRAKWMKGGVRDAVVATAINVMKSLRAVTRTAKHSTVGRPVVEDTGFFGGFSKTINRRCIRAGVGAYSPRVELDAPVKWTRSTNGRRNGRLSHVYKVTPVHERKHYYYVVAYTPEDAMKYELTAAKARIDVLGGTARNALSVAMGMVSTKNERLTGKVEAQKAGVKFAHVRWSGTEGNIGLEVGSDLDYAERALDGGRNIIDIALMRAANSTAAILAKKTAGLFFTDDFSTPFPGIAKHRGLA